MGLAILIGLLLSVFSVVFAGLSVRYLANQIKDNRRTVTSQFISNPRRVCFSKLREVRQGTPEDYCARVDVLRWTLKAECILRSGEVEC